MVMVVIIHDCFSVIMMLLVLLYIIHNYIHIIRLLLDLHASYFSIFRVLPDGSIAGIIGGTGIQDTEAGYTPTTTDFSHASPGVGAVLIALAEMIQFQT